MKKVVVGLSGGVDSAVVCWILKQQGYEIIAVFMQNWDSYVNQENNYQSINDKCDAQYDWEDAQKIAKQIGVPIYHVNFVKEYWDHVFSYFLEEYRDGKTPNPDILCNRYIKFGSFYEYVFKKFNPDYVATGHYASVQYDNGLYYLKKAKDESKDQTYFLCSLNQEQLSKALFPLSDFSKEEVRKIAKNNKLTVWDKKDSTGICFIGERKFSRFLENYISPKTGTIVDIETNEVIGSHNGMFHYTIGQNKNLNLGGNISKYFVCQKDATNNIIYVVSREHKDKYLISYQCQVFDFNWIISPKRTKNLYARFRHRQIPVLCEIEISNNRVTIKYKNGTSALALGQYVVLYQDDICLGGGEISTIGDSI